jgi:adenine/guanine phosphoribosyltransferase-like PRPP-binding protein
MYAVESGIDFRKGEWVDICHIISFDTTTFKIQSTFERRKQAEIMKINSDPRDTIVYPFQEMVYQLIDDYKWTPDQLGVPKTVGEELSKLYDIEKSNWMEKLIGISRKSHILNCMYNLQEDTEDHWIRELLVRSLKKTEESVDIYPIYNHPLLMKILLHLINKFIKTFPKQPTHVAGLDFFGGLLAQGLSLEYGLTIIPIRKKNKLMSLTYSSENLEIPKQDYKDAIVLVVDDIITTGEFLRESLELFEKNNIETIGGIVVTEEAKSRHTTEIRMGKYPYYVLLWDKI